MIDSNLNYSPMTPLRPCDHIQDRPEKIITLVAYGDYQNLRSGQAYFMIKNLLTTFNDQLCFVYRHFPQAPPRSSAWKAAEAAEVASDQGKFWEMHDILSRNHLALDDGDLVSYADQLGLNIP
ncbi:MAG: disulfide bond formation protein DsbA, partial [Cyanobacteria bacterium P01_A01_bin.84]